MALATAACSGSGMDLGHADASLASEGAPLVGPEPDAGLAPDLGQVDSMLAAVDVRTDLSPPDLQPSPDAQRPDARPATDSSPAVDSVALKTVESLPICSVSVVSNSSVHCPLLENGTKWAKYPLAPLPDGGQPLYRCMGCVDQATRQRAVVPAACRAQAQGDLTVVNGEYIEPIFDVVCLPDGVGCGVCVPGGAVLKS